MAIKHCLNLACGNDIREQTEKQRWVNLDLTSPCDVRADITQPLPFKWKTFDLVLAAHILEHIQDLRALKLELARILKHGGKLVIVVPHYHSPDAYGDDTHCRQFSFHSFWSQYWPGFHLQSIERQGKNNVSPEWNEEQTLWIVAQLLRMPMLFKDVKKKHEDVPFVKAGLGNRP